MGAAAINNEIERIYNVEAVDWIYILQLQERVDARQLVLERELIDIKIKPQKVKRQGVEGVRK